MNKNFKCTDEEVFLEVSDDALERLSSSSDMAVPTLIGTYCFGCPPGEYGRAERRAVSVLSENYIRPGLAG